MFQWGQQLLQQGQNMIRSIQEHSAETVQEFVNTLHNPPHGEMQFVSGQVPIFSHSFNGMANSRQRDGPVDNSSHTTSHTTSETTTNQPRTEPPRQEINVNMVFENLIQEINDVVEQIQVHQATQASTQESEQREPAGEPLPAEISDSLQRIRGADVVLECGRDHTCSICLETCSTRDCLVKLPCQHTFHEDCILEWFRQKSICPICRKQVEMESSPTTLQIRVRVSSQTTETITIQETETPRDVLRKLGLPATNSVLCANQRLSLDESLILQGICDNTLLVIW